MKSGVDMAAGAMLTHFTRASRSGSAMDNLISILDQRLISGGRRMIRGGKHAVCLFDLPLKDLSTLLVRENRRRYEPFGIAVNRRYAFKIGARPVIYMPWSEARRTVAPSEYWRVVSLELSRTPPVDWSYEREWRIGGDLKLETFATAALVETRSDVDVIYDHFDGHPPCAGVIPLRELFGS